MVVRDGPAGERGWLALRLALALGLGGHEVTVALTGEAVALALRTDVMPATPWLGGDAQRDLRGLVGDLEAAVLVDAAALAAAGAGAEALLPGCVAVDEAEYARRLLDAEWVVTT